jgi:hypothetical protein
MSDVLTKQATNRNVNVKIPVIQTTFTEEVNCCYLYYSQKVFRKALLKVIGRQNGN